MDWSGERPVAVTVDDVADRLASPGGGWLRPFLQLAADRHPAHLGERPSGPAHWYRLRPTSDPRRVRFVWRPPVHPSRFGRFRGRFDVRIGPPTVLALSGTTEGGDGADAGDAGDAVVLEALLDLLASAFAGTPEALDGEGPQLDG